ncbi:toprim domain-containing protein [Terribacillus sp. 179-K 1B1 HS]|uniref:toprim domain-containing protein n=1 Tax=Terribacillus sp. 179-K 1B1 HS TaxID=3142388 RepID=UPI0039A303E0
MPNIPVNGRQVDVDITAELSQYEWTRARWTSDKLLSASPFRADNHPSFMANLDGEYAGTWLDSGAIDPDYSSGNFTKLLAFLRDESYEEAAEYLIETYAAPEQSDSFTMPALQLAEGPRQPIVIDEAIIGSHRGISEYLRDERGITEKIQRFFGVGSTGSAVLLPWRHADGRLATVKYRRTDSKLFWYARDAEPVKRCVFGIDKIWRRAASDARFKQAVICEGEIDAMSFYVAGMPAIATGGANVTQRQIDLIRASPLEHVILAADNDEAGAKWAKALTEGLRGHVRLSKITVPGVKDSNEYAVNGGDLAGLEREPIRAVTLSLR